ncbi:MAG TPA: ABC transporter ATP-binding protein [Azospirillum sp.]
MTTIEAASERLQTASHASILSLRSLRKQRGKPGGSTVFELIVPELEVRAGQFVAIVGESGCGKSTLLDMLALVSRPTECAEFRFGDAQDATGSHDVASLWSRQDEAALSHLRASRLGYVLQTGGLLPFLTVEQNILLPFRILGLPPDVERARTLARRIGIENELAKKPHQLSGGQRQRAAILRALVHRPRVILADEPTAAVDRTRAEGIVADLDALVRGTGATVIMVTHDVPLVRPFADELYGFSLENPSPSLVRSTCVRLPPPGTGAGI